MSTSETEVKKDTDKTGEGKDFEPEARKMGWRPQADYKGSPEKWVDAKTWVERGETFIPFLQTSNRELRREIESRDSRLSDMDRQLKMANKAIEDLKEETNETAVASLTDQKADLVERIAAAHEADDIRTELRLRDDLSEINDRIKEKKNGTSGTGTGTSRTDPDDSDVAARRSTKGPADDPIFQGWLSENDWFKKDAVMAGAATALMNQKNADADFRALSPRERLDAVAEEIQARFATPNNRRSGPSKVEGGNRTDSSGSGGGGGRGRSYSDLPEAAQKQCDLFAKRFVGKVDGRGQVKFKDIDAYRASYSRDYFAEDWGAKHQVQ